MSDYLKGTIANPDKIYGKSAYEIAVKYGYRGTEEEWSKEVEANRIATEEARNVAEEMRDRAVTASKGAATRADDAERSAQAAETSSLMAQEARDFATQAAKQAEQFADQIYKHLPGEEERVVAEEQRLTDEATRVANEAERVSSELSRDATFKGWANDIASLPSFDSRISANSDRLTNIEAGLPSSVWRVDATAARIKDVPENARPKAIVSKIGGMTYKCTVAEGEDGYFTGLRSAKVTEVKSVGVNLLHYASNSYSQNGVTVTVNADKSLTIRGTSTEYVWIGLASIKLTAGEQYTAKATNCPSNAHFYLYHDEDRHVFRNSAYTFTTTQSSYGYVFAIDPNITIDVTVYPMLNKGSTAKPCTPYVEHTLPIPEELRPANGINENVYDFIEWAEDGSVKKIVKCGVVDLGTLDWHYVASGNTRFDSYSLSGVLKKISSSSVSNIICTKYEEVGTSNQVYSGLAQIATTDGVIWICDTNYTDVATFKAAMSGVMLVYELAEPEVTDTYADLIIDVEGGGTLTFENEYGYDMPNTVTYMLKEVTS